MISAWTIYFIGIVDKLIHIMGSMLLLCTFSWIICLISAGLTSVCYYKTEEKLFPIFKLWSKRFLYLLFALAVFYSTTPNSKTLAAMYIIPAVANNEKVQSIGKNGLDILENLTNNWLKELKGKKTDNESTKEDI